MSYIKADNPIEQKHFNYLEELRQSGVTNMWGASPWLARSFARHFRGKKGQKAARDVLGKWMNLHDDAHMIERDEAYALATKRKAKSA